MTSSAIAPEVVTTAGELRGEQLAGGLAVFRGIPFAAPPTGDRRFRAPAPVTPWDGVRDATRFGPVAIQGTRGGSGSLSGAFGVGETEMSEDCLTLNVWTPGVDDARRPVMVWIHGGAFRIGSGSSPVYDGSRLASRGDVVVVALNYRLGLLGFMASPELGTANCGLLDQVAGLEWVQREIEAFGGDPHQVTIFGESAGGKSVECLLAMPAARGLFSRAISQSTYAAPMDPEPVAERARAIAAELELGPDEMDQLRTVEVDALLDAEQRVMAAAGPAGIGAGGGGPVVDGQILPAPPLDAVRNGIAADIPLVVGTTLDESRLFAAMGQPADRGEVGEDDLPTRLVTMMGADPTDKALAERAVAAYRAARAERHQSDEPADLVVDAMTDRMFRQHSLRLAEAAARHQPATFMYLFTWESPAMGGRLGACHAIDLGFVFGTVDAMSRFVGDGPEAEQLSALVQDAWLSFARGGAPAAGGLGPWPPYDTANRSTMVLGREPGLVDAPMETIRQVWESVSL